MDQFMPGPGYSSGAGYRGVAAPPPPPSSVQGVAPPQGSKLATYMNRGGPQQPPQNFHDMNNKMSNLSMLNRPPTPGTKIFWKKIFCYLASISGTSFSGGHTAASYNNRPPVTGYSVR